MSVKFICTQCGAKMSANDKVSSVRCPLCRIDMEREAVAPETVSHTEPASATYPQIKVARPVDTVFSIPAAGVRKHASTPAGDSDAKGQAADNSAELALSKAKAEVEKILTSARNQAEALAADIIGQAESEAEQMLELRRSEIDNEVAQVLNQAKSEAESARAEADDIISNARSQAEEQAAGIIAEAKARAEKTIEDARDNIGSIQEKVLSEARSQAEEQATRIIAEAKALAEETLEKARVKVQTESGQGTADSAKPLATTASDSSPAKKPDTQPEKPSVTGERYDAAVMNKEEMAFRKMKMDGFVKRETRFIMMGFSLSFIMLVYVVIILLSTRMATLTRMLSYLVMIFDIAVVGLLGWIVYSHYVKGKKAQATYKQRIKDKKTNSGDTNGGSTVAKPVKPATIRKPRPDTAVLNGISKKPKIKNVTEGDTDKKEKTPAEENKATAASVTPSPDADSSSDKSGTKSKSQKADAIRAAIAKSKLTKSSKGIGKNIGKKSKIIADNSSETPVSSGN